MVRELQEWIDDPASSDLGGPSVEAYEGFIKRLGGPDRACERLTLYLRLPGWAARYKRGAVHLLPCCGWSAVPNLVEAAGHADADARRTALCELANYGWPRYSLRFAKSVNDASEHCETGEERRRFIYAESAVARENLPVFIRALNDEEARVRLCAAQMLGRIGPDAREAVPALIRALDDESVEMRFTAANALGNLGPAASQAVPALEEALKDGVGVVRSAAARAPKKIRGDTPGGEGRK